MNLKARGSLLLTVGMLLGVIVLTLLTFAWMGYDLTKLASVPAGDGRDGYTFIYHLYQAYDNLFHRPLNLGYALIFHNPEDSALFAYTIAPYGIALTALPFYLLSSGNLILTANLFIILTFVLTTGSGFLLVRYLFKTPPLAAWLVALFLTFAPVRIVHLQLSHPETLSMQWLLLSIYCLHRLIDGASRRWAIGLAITFWLNFIISAYLGYFFILYAALLIVYTLLMRHDVITRRLLVNSLLAAVIALVLLIPFYRFRFQNSVALEGHPFAEIEYYSASPLNWTQSTSFIYFKPNPNQLEEKPTFLGFVPLIMLLVGWKLRRENTLVIFLIALIIVGYLLTLGPTISPGNGDKLPAPFMLLMQFPGAGSIRSTPRFILLALIGVALLMGFIFSTLFARLKFTSTVIVLGLIALLLAIESIPYNGLLWARTDSTFRLSAQPTVAFRLGGQTPFVPEHLNTWLASQPPETPVFNYPVNDGANQQYMFSLPQNHQPMLNGETSFYPSWYRDRDWNRFPSLYTLYALRRYGIQFAMIYEPFLRSDELEVLHEHLKQFSDQLQYVDEIDDVEIYRLIMPAPSDANLRFDFDEFVPGEGWYAPEKTTDGVTFAWSQTPESTVVFAPLSADKPRIFRAQLYGNADAEMLNSLHFFVNDQVVYLSAREKDGTTLLEGNIPASAFAGDKLELRFVTVDRPSPIQRGVGSDWRNLGIAFDWLDINAVN